LVGGDDDAAFEDEVNAVADSFRAGEIFRVPASTFIYHSIALHVNLFIFLPGTRRIIMGRRSLAGMSSGR